MKDGKNGAQVFEKMNKNLNWLSYDYASDRFMALVTKVDKFRAGFLFSFKNTSQETNFNLTMANQTVANIVILANDNLIFLANESIYEWALKDLLSSGKGPNMLKPVSFSSKAITLMSDHFRPKTSNICENKQNVCSHRLDYCIPHNKTSFICQSNVSRQTV